MSIALVTGGSRGLGQSMAEHLAAKGHGVILTYKANQAQAEAVAARLGPKGVQAVALPLDVAEPATFPAFVSSLAQVLGQTFGRPDFDILINNAGIGINQPFTETSPEQFDLLMNIHVKGPFFLTQQLLPLMRDGGRIVNVSSGLTRFSFPGYSAYAMMKGAVEVWTRYLAKELGPRGISTVVVAPGAIETDFGGGQVRDNKRINQAIAGQTALGRAGLPDDIGQVVAALASDDCRWINGQRIEASGGMML